MLNRSIISGCLLRFPPVAFAFAYGSAVMPQLGKPSGGNMLDLCFVIENHSSSRWHRQNLKRNASDYSLIARLFGSDFIASVQRSDQVAVWYNTLVPVASLDIDKAEANNLEYIKYGVVEKRDFISDLSNWRSLYLAGRCQKPVGYIDSLPPCEEIRNAWEQNLKSAVNVALLQLPAKFTSQDLFTCIAGLSYNGDFRMIFGEDRDKIRKLVLGALPRLLELYSPLLKQDASVHQFREDARFEQDMCPAVKLRRLLSLPSSVRDDLLKQSKEALSSSVWRHHVANPDVEEIFASMASWSDDSRLAKLLGNATQSIVFRSSITQSIKGIITAGPYKAALYAGDKLKKSLNSRFSGPR